MRKAVVGLVLGVLAVAAVAAAVAMRASGQEAFVSKFAGGDPDAAGATTQTKVGEGPVNGWEAYLSAART